MHVKALSRYTLVFDLDGTLVDTAADLIDTLNRVFVAEGLAQVGARVLRHRVGEGVRAMIGHASGHHGVALSESKIDVMATEFLSIYADNCAERSRPFPGVVTTLQTFRDSGARMAVCTNKQGKLARMILDQLALHDFFSVVVGSDETEHKKPHGEHFADTVTRAGGNARYALMIGDSGSDVATARNCGARVILVDYGYSSIPARLLGADAVVSDFADIPALAVRLAASDAGR